jgi:hypothetical protein
MSSIDKTGNGRWRARYRDPAGKSRSRTFRRKGDAERFLAATATDIHRGDWVDPKLRRARFDEWADAFEDGLVRLAPTTARRYRQLLTLQIRPWFGGRPIAPSITRTSSRLSSTCTGADTAPRPCGTASPCCHR